MEIKLESGLHNKVEKQVAYEDTAKVVASGLAEVFSTPSMIALMEKAAYSAVQLYLPKGMSTVGISISAKHMAATPVGMKVWATATLVETDGRKLKFEIEAFDETEQIGQATHTRFVVDEAKFMDKAARKQP